MNSIHTIDEARLGIMLKELAREIWTARISGISA